MTSRGEAYEANALCTSGPPAADLSAQRVQWRRVPDVERITEHARLHAYLAEPPGHRFGFVRSVFGIPAAGQDDHVRAVHRGIHGQSFQEGTAIRRFSPPRGAIGGGRLVLEECEQIGVEFVLPGGGPCPAVPAGPRWRPGRPRNATPPSPPTRSTPAPGRRPP